MERGAPKCFCIIIAGVIFYLLAVVIECCSVLILKNPLKHDGILAKLLDGFLMGLLLCAILTAMTYWGLNFWMSISLGIGTIFGLGAGFLYGTILGLIKEFKKGD